MKKRVPVPEEEVVPLTLDEWDELSGHCRKLQQILFLLFELDSHESFTDTGHGINDILFTAYNSSSLVCEFMERLARMKSNKPKAEVTT